MTDAIKQHILAALKHPEAEDGLYFRNFYFLHEEDEREAVPGSEYQILNALRELISEGQVVTDESGEEVVFFLNQ